MVWHSKVDTSVLHPALVDVMNRAFEILEEGGTPFKTYSGLRTFNEQNELYAQGRTKPGNIVTKAKGGQSMHNYGLACDSAPLTDPNNPAGNIYWPGSHTNEGEVWYDLERAVMDAVADTNVDIDIEWGGRWKFRDLPHVQVRITLNELRAGHYPPCSDVEWLVKAHTTFLFDTDWMDRRVQFLLNAVGYDCGPVDGVIGPRTQKAVNRLQQAAYSLQETEEGYDPETVTRLVEMEICV